MNRRDALLRWSVACMALLLANACLTERVCGQAGLRKSLERLDTNGDGVIDPDEITPLARPYLEQIVRSRRMSLDRPNEIEKLQEAARVHSALRNGVSGRDVRPEGENSIKPFGAVDGVALVPEFGLPVIKYPYTQEDLDEADRTMRRYDGNEDGFIDRAEAARSRWTHRNPFEMDLDKDNRLSRLELGQRYARRRLLSGATEQLGKSAWRASSSNRTSSRDEREQERDQSQWWRRGGSGTWLTASVLGRFDANRNGRLESGESQKLGIPTARIDINRDNEISREELQAYLTGLQDEVGDTSEGLPSWFFELDTNRDRQVEMSEFVTEWTDEKVQEFISLDTNGDGLLTSSEVVQSNALVGGSYHNQDAEVLPPRKTIISEIEIDEDYLIGDLNVQISITHSSTSFLDAYLTGPEGQRVELFTEIGGSGDNFDQTFLDDQSRYPITKARAPFKGTFAPEAVGKKQPSLSHFNGKSIKGVWQLVIRGSRSERFGMLHGWSLIVKPQEKMLGSTAAAPVQDGPRGGSPSRETKPNSEKDATRLKAEAREREIAKYQAWVKSQKSSEGKKSGEEKYRDDKDKELDAKYREKKKEEKLRAEEFPEKRYREDEKIAGEKKYADKKDRDEKYRDKKDRPQKESAEEKKSRKQ
ncbi:MAG: proprotein convertase P-domain-containing protein [Pirellulaceae bacterium]